MTIKLNTKYILGGLCRSKHNHENTGKSLRYEKSGTCVICQSKHNKGIGKSILNGKASANNTHEFTALEKRTNITKKKLRPCLCCAKDWLTTINKRICPSCTEDNENVSHNRL